ncbi:MAG: hypothetical protein U1F65_05765 [Verrucomicrobiota bacterium]
MNAENQTLSGEAALLAAIKAQTQASEPVTAPGKTPTVTAPADTSEAVCINVTEQEYPVCLR